MVVFSFLPTYFKYFYYSNLRTQRKAIHMNLIVALGLAQLIFIAGIETTYDRVACAAVAALLHYFFTATFTWMLCEGIQLYVKIITVFNSNSRFKQPFYYIIGWGECCVLHFHKLL